MDLCFETGHKNTEKNGFVVIYALFFTTKAYFWVFVVKYKRFWGEHFNAYRFTIQSKICTKKNARHHETKNPRPVSRG